MGELNRRQLLAALPTGLVLAGNEAPAVDGKNGKSSVASLRSRRDRFKAQGGKLVSVGEHVLGFYHIHILPQRPDDGGAAHGELEVNLPAGTKNFYVWLAGFLIYFVDKDTGDAVDRPLSAADVHVEAHQNSAGKWLIGWDMGWADANDTTHWEGEISLFGIVTG